MVLRYPSKTRLRIGKNEKAKDISTEHGNDDVLVGDN